MSGPGETVDRLMGLVIAMLAGLLIGLHIPRAPRHSRPTDSPSSAELHPVMRVIDGDTLTVWREGAVRTVRLLGIDTPEIGEPGYEEARESLKKMVGRGPVRLEGAADPDRMERDRFGRLLAYVYLGGRCVNVEMVRSGHSPYWTRYGESRLAPDFEKAEAEARGK